MPRGPGYILPDLIFLDLNMMGNQKIERLKHLKKKLRTKDVPVVIYSTAQIPDIDEISKNFGAYKFIVKPYTFTDVTVEIKKIISELEM